MRSALLAACLICGCGRIDFAPVAGDALVGSGSGSGSNADPGDAGAVSSDVAPAGVCGGAVLLADDFEDGAIAPVWTELTGTNLTVAETAGFLQITYASNVPATQAAGYITTSNLDFTGPASTSSSRWRRTPRPWRAPRSGSARPPTAACSTSRTAS